MQVDVSIVKSDKQDRKKVRYDAYIYPFQNKRELAEMTPIYFISNTNQENSIKQLFTMEMTRLSGFQHITAYIYIWKIINYIRFF